MVNDSTFLAVSTGVACVAAATVYWAFTRHSRAPSPSPTHARSHGMSPSGVMAIGGEEEMDFGRLQLVDVATGEVLHDLDGHENIVVSVALSPSGRFLASGSYDSSWRLWDAVTGEELLVVWGHSDFGGPCICDIRRWDYNIPFAVVKKNCTAEGHSGGVTSLAFSSCGKWLASGGGSGSLLVWDAGAGTAAVHLIGEQMKRLTSGAIADCDGVMSLAFTADTAFLASAGGRGGVGVWDWRAGTQVHSFDAEAGDIEVSLSPDSRTLVVSGNGGVQFWDIRSGDLVNESEDDGALLSPDGLTLATFGDYGGTIVLRDAATLEPRELEHELWVSRDGSRLFKMAFHPDGGLFAAVPFLDRYPGQARSP